MVAETDSMASGGRTYGALSAEDEAAPLTPESQSMRDSRAEDSVVERVQRQRRRYSMMQFAVAGVGALAVAGTVAYTGTVAGGKGGAVALDESAAQAPAPPTGKARGFDDTGSGTDDATDVVSMDNGKVAPKLVPSYEKDEEGLYIPSTDPNATRATKALLTALVDVANTDSIMFGHENTNIEGQWFWDEYGNEGHSDVTNATGGGFPSVVGYNAEQILTGQNWTTQVHEAYARGSVVTFFWSASNPVNGGSSLNCHGHPMKNLLPGGTGNGNWTKDLDKIGAFFKGLKYQGDHIPIIFRIFHECTGSWYWWGEECSHSGEYIEAWKYTQWYLREVVGVHNLLYIYAPSKPSDTFYDSYDVWWPGDDAVDIVGFDRYSKYTLYPTNILKDCQNVSSLAITKGKVVALGETGIADGIQGVTNSSWFMHDFVNILMNDPLCSKLTYALTFANESPNRYWVPLKGNPTHKGFIEFYQSDLSIFAGDTRWTSLMKMYGFGPRSSATTDDAPISDDPNLQAADDQAAQAPDDDIGTDASDVDDAAAIALGNGGLPQDDDTAAALAAEAADDFNGPGPATSSSTSKQGQAMPPSPFNTPSH